MPSIGTTEWVIIAAIILLIFGGKKIPEFFKDLGESVKEFKKAAKDTKDDEGKKSKS